MKKLAINFAELKEAISEVRSEAMEIAKEHYPCVRSRGVEISAGDEHGVDNFTTKKELIKTLELMISEGASEIYIQGGFDAAESPYSLNNDDYCPFASEWSMKVWDKNGYKIQDAQAA